ncbi:MAG: alpha/beta fold hydrolase [Actinomycetota bacterium]|nr:alpha/beta fold hydrolase [Actinomycetota bacterium]
MLRTFAAGRLFGTRSGDVQPAVLALHGWARTHHDFDAVLRPAGGAELAAVAVDLPGFGSSPPPTEPWGSAEYAACVEALLDELGGPVVVLGHSFGGRVAVHVAATRPDAVRALVLTGVPLLRLSPPSRPALAYRALRALHQAGLLGDERLEHARRRYGSADYAAAAGIMRQVHSRVVAESYEAQLDAIACPVTLVWGEDDTTVPLTVATTALDRLRRSDPTRAELVTLQGAGHLVPLSSPAALRQAVERHLW